MQNAAARVLTRTRRSEYIKFVKSILATSYLQKTAGSANASLYTTQRYVTKIQFYFADLPKEYKHRLGNF